MITNHPSQAWIRAYWWVALNVRWLQQLKYFLSLASFFAADLAVPPRAKAHRRFSNCGSQEKQTSVSWTWSRLFSYQSQVIDYKLTGCEHSVPGRCGRQDYSCHKCPVMQQSHKQFFFFFFCSTEPMNSSSPRHPSSSSSKTQRMPFTLPPSASSFPSCAQAHPCQHKNAKQPTRPWTLETHSWPLILTYLCLTVHMKW